MRAKEEHPEKTSSFKVIKFVGKAVIDNDEQFLKALIERVVAFTGKDVRRSDVHPLIASAAMLVILEEIESCVIEVHPKKALLCSTEEREEGIEVMASMVQPIKALVPIEVIALGIDVRDNEVHPRNAEDPIILRVDGNDVIARDVHPEKQL